MFKHVFECHLHKIPMIPKARLGTQIFTHPTDLTVKVCMSCVLAAKALIHNAKNRYKNRERWVGHEHTRN